METREEAQRTYRLPSSLVAEAQARVEKLNRKAAKLGAPAVELTVGEPVLTPEKAEVLPGEWEETGRMLSFTDVTVSTEPVRLSGWEFVAALDLVQTDEGPETIMRVAPAWQGQDLPEEFRAVDPSRCDHCKLDRKRKSSYVVRNEDGSYRAVGSNCLHDFLGVSPAAAIAALTYTVELGALFDEWAMGGAGSADAGFGMQHWMAQVNAVVRVKGWTSRKKAEETYRQATADVAWEIMTTRKPDEFQRQAWAEMKAAPADSELAEQQVEWARERFATQATLSDYEHNLKVALQVPVTRRTAGLTASLSAWHWREVTRAAEKAENGSNEPTQPLVEGRREIVGEVVSSRSQEGYSYNSTVYKMLVREDDGNKVWGTVPAAIEDAYHAAMNAHDEEAVASGGFHNWLKGKRVRFTAKVERSRDDQHFGFGSRPSKAAIVKEEK